MERGRFRRFGLEDKRLYCRRAVLVGPAQKGSNRPAGQTFDGRDQLRSHRTLKRVSLQPDEFGFARLHEVSLGSRRTVLQHAYDEVLVDEGPRPRCSSAREVGNDLAELIRERGVQRTTR